MSLAARANEIQHGEWKLQYYNIYRGLNSCDYA